MLLVALECTLFFPQTFSFNSTPSLYYRYKLRNSGVYKSSIKLQLSKSSNGAHAPFFAWFVCASNDQSGPA